MLRALHLSGYEGLRWAVMYLGSLCSKCRSADLNNFRDDQVQISSDLQEGFHSAKVGERAQG